MKRLLMLILLAGGLVPSCVSAAVPVQAPAFVGRPQDWLNTDDRPIAWKPGKVMLVDFWEYTCVNCIRTLPYLKAWHERYERHGLVIVGVHTPEFKFAQDRENVVAAVKRFGLSYPVLLDSGYANWRLWQGDTGYWPRKFLVDARGIVVYDHAGEGGYGETEATIQSLLRELNPGAALPPLMEPVRPEDHPGAVCYPVTPEMYAGLRGYHMGQHASLKRYDAGAVVSIRTTDSVEDGKFTLRGAWRTERESLRHARRTRSLSDSVTIRYHALSCNAVVRPEDGQPFRMYVWQDGKPVPKPDSGDDIRYDTDGRSYVLVDTPRMYNLITARMFASHRLKLAADSPGFGLYSFTFSSCVAK